MFAKFDTELAGEEVCAEFENYERMSVLVERRKKSERIISDRVRCLPCRRMMWH